MACVVATVAVYLTFVQGNPGLFGFEGGALPDVLPTIGLAVVMALGIFFGSMFRRMGTTDRQVQVFKEAREVIQSSSFIAALCVAPLVFFGAFVTVRGSPGDPASYLLAFQNGFFCESIFRRMFRDGAGSADTSAPQKTT
jgi:hypothetical protein